MRDYIRERPAPVKPGALDSNPCPVIMCGTGRPRQPEEERAMKRIGILVLLLVLAGVACVLDGPWSLGKAADIQMPGFRACR